MNTSKFASRALVLVLGISLLVVGLAGSAPPVGAQTPPGGTIVFPADVLADFSVADATSVTFAGGEGEFLVVGYAPRTFDPEGKVKSFMAIYQRSATGFDQVYRYVPVPTADYPMPLSFENVWAINGMAGDKFGTLALVTSWGETGADYFGTQPIVFNYVDGKFKAVELLKGKLADDPRIRGFDWTSPDFQVSNEFDPTNTVQTILAQGISVQGNTVTLSFFGDNECKACEHKMVNIDLTVGQE
jgi:hypothetical protein